jgi:hypothetical protein
VLAAAGSSCRATPDVTEGHVIASSTTAREPCHSSP